MVWGFSELCVFATMALPLSSGMRVARVGLGESVDGRPLAAHPCLRKTKSGLPIFSPRSLAGSRRDRRRRFSQWAGLDQLVCGFLDEDWPVLALLLLLPSHPFRAPTGSLL